MRFTTKFASFLNNYLKIFLFYENLPLHQIHSLCKSNGKLMLQTSWILGCLHIEVLCVVYVYDMELEFEQSMEMQILEHLYLQQYDS